MLVCQSCFSNTNEFDLICATPNGVHHNGVPALTPHSNKDLHLNLNEHDNWFRLSKTSPLDILVFDADARMFS